MSEESNNNNSVANPLTDFRAYVSWTSDSMDDHRPSRNFIKLLVLFPLISIHITWQSFPWVQRKWLQLFTRFIHENMRPVLSFPSRQCYLICDSSNYRRKFCGNPITIDVTRIQTLHFNTPRESNLAYICDCAVSLRYSLQDGSDRRILYSSVIIIFDVYIFNVLSHYSKYSVVSCIGSLGHFWHSH